MQILLHTSSLNPLSSNGLLSPLSLMPRLNSLTLTPRRAPSTVIRMGGGPRTFPGGVSKWQWKRMQAKKAKQLLKARLSRERQIYEMRKRAELKAAVSDLERPWEIVQKSAPSSSSLFSVSADEQLKVLADRFQKPGGYDLWTENDGPQIFVTPDDGLPTARFFPKGVVHSIRPYGRIDQGNGSYSSESESSDFGGLLREKKSGVEARRNDRRRIGSRDGSGRKMMDFDDKHSEGLNSKLLNANEQHNDQTLRKNLSSGVAKMVRTRKSVGSTDQNDRRRIDSRDASGRKMTDFNGQHIEGLNSKLLNSCEQRNDPTWRNNQSSGVSKMDKTRKRVGSTDQDGRKLMGMEQEKIGSEHRDMGAKVSRDVNKWPSRGRNSEKTTNLQPEDVYDMSLQLDGTYGFSGTDQDSRLDS